MKPSMIFFILAVASQYSLGMSHKSSKAVVVKLPPIIVQPAKNCPQVTADAVYFPTVNKGHSDLVGATMQIVNSPEFKSRVLGAYYNKRPGFTYTTDTPEQVMQKVLNGNERTNQEGNDCHWSLKYKFQLQAPKPFQNYVVVGWTTPYDPIVYINTYGYDKRSDAGIVGTIVHEEAHKLGYDHPFNNTPDRPYSVPYALGNIAAELYSKKFGVTHLAAAK